MAPRLPHVPLTCFEGQDIDAARIDFREPRSPLLWILVTLTAPEPLPRKQASGFQPVWAVISGYEVADARVFASTDS